MISLLWMARDTAIAVKRWLDHEPETITPWWPVRTAAIAFLPLVALIGLALGLGR